MTGYAGYRPSDDGYNVAVYGASINMVYTVDQAKDLIYDLEHAVACAETGTEALVASMSTKTSWKIIRSLADEGRLVLTKEDVPPYRTWINLEEWEAMSDEMRERAVTALEEIAVQLRRMNDSNERSAPRAWPDYETKTTCTETGGRA